MFAGQYGLLCFITAQRSFIWVRSAFELLTVIFVGWLWWAAVVDHCHWQSGAPCHIWQQSDMVIQSWGYEWLGVVSLNQADSVNPPVGRLSAGVSPCWWLTGHLSTSTESGLTKLPSWSFYIPESYIFILMMRKRGKMEEGSATCQFSFLLFCCSKLATHYFVLNCLYLDHNQTHVHLLKWTKLQRVLTSLYHTLTANNLFFLFHTSIPPGCFQLH